jgi:hypothetical protein
MTPTVTIRGITARVPEGCPHFAVHKKFGWEFIPNPGSVYKERCPISNPIAACVAEHWFRREAEKGQKDVEDRKARKTDWGLGQVNRNLEQAELWHRIAEGESDEKA